MISQIYVENVISPIIYPLRHEIGENFIFMDDNARPHRAVQLMINKLPTWNDQLLHQI